MLDLLKLMVTAALGFLIGRWIAALLRWVSQTRQDPRRQNEVANYWRFIGFFGIPWSLSMAALKAAERNAQGVEDYLVECFLFIFMFLGAWVEARRIQRRKD